MTHDGKRRAGLYSAAVLLGAGLLFAGFGITVPPDPGTRLSGAEMLAQMGQQDKAIELCRTTIAEHPDCIEARIYLATFLAAAGRTDDALAAYGDAIERNRSADIARDLELDRASVLAAAGRLQEARQARERLAAGGQDHRIHQLDGVLAECGKDWIAATSAWRRAAETRPEDARIQSRICLCEMERGRAALAAGRLEEARDAFDAARSAVPGEPSAQLKSAEVRLVLKDAEGAMDILRGLRPRTPGASALVFRVSACFLDAGDEERALWSLGAALQADPAGTRALLDADPSWATRRDSEAVRALLAQIGTANPGGLTVK